jgi:hypothetical protein
MLLERKPQTIYETLCFQTLQGQEEESEEESI